MVCNMNLLKKILNILLDVIVGPFIVSLIVFVMIQSNYLIFNYFTNICIKISLSVFISLLITKIVIEIDKKINKR